MRRLLVHVLLMTITFGFGLGFDWLIPKRKLINARPTEKVDVVMPQVVEVPPVPPVSPVTPTRKLIFDYDPSKFTPDGVYFINGPTPHEFREFNAFDLSWGGIEGELSGYVGIQTFSNNEYGGQPAVFAVVTEQRLFFVTSRFDNGSEYRFDGEFLRKDIESNADKAMSVLRGKLTKTKDGRKIAERVLNFRVRLIGW
jgi:hypothetical protein